MEKTFKQKNFNNFVWTPLGSRVNIYINFCLQVHFKVSAAWYCSHYLPPVSTTLVANLSPVSLIPVAICHRRRWHWWQICHRYQKRKRKWWKNLPPVSLIPVVYLDSRISPRIFEKIWNGLNGILWGWGETDSRKKPEAKNHVTLSFKVAVCYRLWTECACSLKSVHIIYVMRPLPSISSTADTQDDSDRKRATQDDSKRETTCWGEREGRGWARSQIIYKSFNTL